jgi:hypothetical protein
MGRKLGRRNFTMGGSRFKWAIGAAAILIAVGLVSTSGVANASAASSSASHATSKKPATSNEKSTGSSRRLPTAMAYRAHVKWQPAGSISPSGREGVKAARRAGGHTAASARTTRANAKASSRIASDNAGAAIRRAESANGESANTALAAPSPDVQFQGLSNTLNPSDPLNYGDDVSSDPSIAAGPTVVMEAVGTAIAVFDKTSGGLEYATDMVGFEANSGLGAPCVASDDDNYGDPQVFYDSVNDRFLVTMQAFMGKDIESGPTYECIAASTSGDPVSGTWNYYAVPLPMYTCATANKSSGACTALGSFGYGGDEYLTEIKTALWTDGLYMSSDLSCEDTCTGYNSSSFILGVEFYAFNLSDLESGAPLRALTTVGTGWNSTSTFPNTSDGDADGPAPATFYASTGTPPAYNSGEAAPEYFTSGTDADTTNSAEETKHWNFWQWGITNWTTGASWVEGTPTATPANGAELHVSTNTYYDNSADEAEPVGNVLYSDYDYTQQYPQYTDIGGQASLWQTFASEPAGTDAAPGSPEHVTYLQSPLTPETQDPDGQVASSFTQQFTDNNPPVGTSTGTNNALTRWLPSETVDSAGDMAIEYAGTNANTANGALQFPSLFEAGRLATDPVNTLEQTETELYQGNGDQFGVTDTTDFTSYIDSYGPDMTVLDPNGCEIWMVGQYDIGHPAAYDGSGNQWGTVISAVHFSGCTSSTLPTSVSTSGTADVSQNSPTQAGTATLTATVSNTTENNSGVGGVPVSFTLGGTAVGTATTNSNGVATLTGADASTFSAGTNSGAVGASFAGSGEFTSSSGSGTLLVGTTQAISFGAISGTYTVGGSGPSLSATGGASGNPITFTASSSGVCSVSGTTVTLLAGGTCTITANQAGDGVTYLAAPPVSQSFNVAREAQTLTTSGTWASTTQTVGTKFTAAGSSSSGLPIYFTSDEQNCTEYANYTAFADPSGTPQDIFVPLVAGSTCVITENQDGNAQFAPTTLAVNVAVGATALTDAATFGVTNASRTLNQLQGTSDPISWTSGGTTSGPSNAAGCGGSATAGGIVCATTNGTVSAASIAASSALTVAATATTVTAASESGTTVTLTMSSNTGFFTGQAITVSGITPAGYSGSFTVASTSGTTKITYAAAASLGTATLSSAKATPVTQGATESGSTVTITTTASNSGKFNVGDAVTIAGVGVSGYNGNFTVTSVPTTTSFTYTDGTSGLATSGIGTATDTNTAGAQESGTTVTLNLTSPPTVTLTPGSSVITVAGVTPSGYNGSWTVTAVPTSTSVQYTDTSSGLAVGGAGSISLPGTSCVLGGTNGNETLTALHSGTCTVNASIGAINPPNPNTDLQASYSAGTGSTTYTLTAGTQTVTWSPTASASVGTSPFTATATLVDGDSNGLAPGAITSTTTSVCTVGSTTQTPGNGTTSGTSVVTVTPLTTGTCTLSAAGNSGNLDWNALGAASANFTVTNALPATINFNSEAPPINDYVDGSSFNVDPTATSGATVSVTTTGPCNAAGDTISLTGSTGTCALYLSAPSSGSYAATSGETAQISSIVDDFGVDEATMSTPTGFTAGQSVTIAGSTVAAYNGSFTVQSIVSPTTFVFVSNADYGGSNVQASDFSGTVSAGSGSVAAVYFPVQEHDQLIEFAPNGLPDASYGAADFELTGTDGAISADAETEAATGLPISFAASGSCTVYQDNGGNTWVHITGAGSCTITASQSGTSLYNAAPDSSQSFLIGQAASTITFPSIPSQSVGSPDFSPGATDSSGDPISYTASGPCTIVSGKVHITGAGECTVTAHGVGDTNYEPPARVSQSFSIGTGSTALQTTPTSATISIGQSNTDGATVTGNAGAGSPTGTVTFYECGPTESAQACTSQTNEVGSPVTLTAGAGNTSTATSAGFTPGSPGEYCFAGYYSGDSNYSASTDTTIDECFVVTEAPTSTVTSPATSAIALGNNNSDSATVTGNATDGSPTGTVTFYECGPTAAAQACTSQANQVGSPVTLTAGAGNTSTANSANLMPDATGYWCFAGYYSGDSNYASSSDATIDECFDVTQASTTTNAALSSNSIVLGASDSDSATVTGNAGGGSPTGTVTFYECGPTVSAQACTSQSNEVGSAVTLAPGSGNTSSAESATFTPTSTGYWCLDGVYSGDSNYQSSSDDTTTDECVDVSMATSAAASNPTLPSVALGESDSDVLTVTGNSAGGAPTGTVTFYECGPDLSGSVPCTSQDNEVGSDVTLTSSGGDTSTATSADFSPDTTGTYCFGAYYGGDSNYTASSDTTTGECFTVVAASSSTASSPQSTSIVLGATDSDSATVTGSDAFGSPTGTVSFYECGPTGSAQSCTSQANQVGTAVALTSAGADTSTANSANFTPHATGYFCFYAVYSGDSNYGGSADHSVNECFDVTEATTTTTTGVSQGSIALGASDSDSATVAGNAGGGSPTGTVTFYECGPTATAQTCTSESNEVGSAVTVTPGSGNTSSAQSANFTPTAPGYWCLDGVYSGDSNYQSSSDDTTTDECVDVTKATSSTVTSPASSSIGPDTSNTDLATVTGNSAGGSPTGTVTFYECGPTDTAQSCTSQSNQVGSAVALVAGASDTSTATSADFTPESTGEYCFAAYYAGDSNYSSSNDTTIEECFDVAKNTSSMTTSPQTASIVLGTTDSDSATITGNATSGSPTGTVSYYFCGPTVSAQSCTSETNQVGSAISLVSSGSDTSTANSANLTPHSTGYYCFYAVYSGDSNYAGATDSSVNECFDVTVATSTTGSTPAHTVVTPSASNTDAISVTGNTAGGAPTGTVDIYECGATSTPNACTSRANEVGTGVTLSAGSGDVSYATSATFHSSAVGYYCFAAYYLGSSNYSASSDTAEAECYFVGKAPKITKFTPASGEPGKVVTITGTNLLDATSVTIGSLRATVTSDTARTIKIKIPTGAKNGFINVTTPAGAATSATRIKIT